MPTIQKKYYTVYWKGQVQSRFDNLRGAQSYRRSLIKDLSKGWGEGDKARIEREVEIREEIYNVEKVQTQLGPRYWSKDWEK